MKTEMNITQGSNAAQHQIVNVEATVMDLPPAQKADQRLTRQQIKDALARCKSTNAGPKYRLIGNKPEILIDALTVLSDDRRKFQDKLLCDGLTFNLGDTCPFSCTFCYVPDAVRKNHGQTLTEFNAGCGLDLRLDEVVIRRRACLDTLKRQLLKSDGSPFYSDPSDKRVIYSSTLTDVAGTKEMLTENAAALLLILQHTNWQVRLLSKSPLLADLVIKKMIPDQYLPRLILGFSTGTLDNRVAAAIERHTGSVTRRIQALHQLQDLGIRTFAMICPSLPYGTQEEYNKFSADICRELRIDRCETVFAEVINSRGQSLTTTANALRNAGFEVEAGRIEQISGPASGELHEEYARRTFEAHCQNVPADKLRFLQYVTARTADYWKEWRAAGAVLLGSYAEANDLITITSSAPSEPQRELNPTEILERNRLEQTVTDAEASSIGAARALNHIHTYENGLMWNAEYRTFVAYCQRKWAFQKSQTYRLLAAGRFLASLETVIPIDGKKLPTNAGQVERFLKVVPEEHQLACWQTIVADREPATLKVADVASAAKDFLRKCGFEEKGKMKKNQKQQSEAHLVARRQLNTFRRALAKLPDPQRFKVLLDCLEVQIEQPQKLDPELSVEIGVDADAPENDRQAHFAESAPDGQDLAADPVLEHENEPMMPPALLAAACDAPCDAYSPDDIVTISQARGRIGSKHPTRQSFHDAIKRGDLQPVPNIPGRSISLSWGDIVKFREKGGFCKRNTRTKNSLS